MRTEITTFGKEYENVINYIQLGK